MKNLFQKLTIRAILIVGLLSFVSCTITKRVHRKGDHIECNKNYSQTAASERSEFEEGKLVDDESLVLSSEVDDQEEDSISNSSLVRLDNIDLSSTEDELDQEEQTESRLENANNQSIDLDETYNERKFTSNKILQRVNKNADVSQSNSEMGVLGTLGIVLMGLGLILIIGSLFLYFGFNGFGGLFNSLVLSGNGFIASVFGFILFLIILLFVIVCVVLVEYVLGGYVVGFIVGGSLIVLGALLMIIHHLIKS